jgi:hypothetical protein
MRLLWVVEGKGDNGRYAPTNYVATARPTGKRYLAYMRELEPTRLFRLVPYVPGAQRYQG